MFSMYYWVTFPNLKSVVAILQLGSVRRHTKLWIDARRRDCVIHIFFYRVKKTILAPSVFKLQN